MKQGRQADRVRHQAYRAALGLALGLLPGMALAHHRPLSVVAPDQAHCYAGADGGSDVLVTFPRFFALHILQTRLNQGSGDEFVLVEGAQAKEAQAARPDCWVAKGDVLFAEKMKKWRGSFPAQRLEFDDAGKHLVFEINADGFASMGTTEGRNRKDGKTRLYPIYFSRGVIEIRIEPNVLSYWFSYDKKSRHVSSEQYQNIRQSLRR